MGIFIEQSSIALGCFSFNLRFPSHLNRIFLIYAINKPMQTGKQVKITVNSSALIALQKPDILIKHEDSISKDLRIWFIKF